MKKVISKAVNIILVLVLLLAAGVMVLTGVNAKSGKATTILGYGFMAVQTGSMTPEYPIGSVIIIKETDPSKLNKNDVITFYSSHPGLNNMIVTHRIVEIIDDGDGTYSFTTKGDANEINDEYPAEGEKVIGKVLAKSSLMEKLVNLRQNPATFFVLILLPMCTLIAFEVFSIYKKNTAAKDGKSSENEEKK
ncbi:MAG: signal peptidase I [Clostridia bacterium]|nr:signal peptidase I [Clostridia bacterium]